MKQHFMRTLLIFLYCNNLTAITEYEFDENEIREIVENDFLEKLKAFDNVCQIIGQSPHYKNPRGATKVYSYDELKKSLENGERNLCIPSGATIVIPNHIKELILPNDTILGTCDYNLIKLRARLKIPNVDFITDQTYEIINTGNNVKIINLKIEGPAFLDGKIIKIENYVMGIQSFEDTSNLEIVNCEIYGFTSAGISVKGIGARIHHNYIHSNMKTPFGYGIVMLNGEAEIWCNVFDLNRHSIAGSGRSSEKYFAHHNLQLPELDYKTSRHAFDMHENNGYGGYNVQITDNIFIFGGTDYDNYPSINIRGVPKTGPALIEKNIFYPPLKFRNVAHKNCRTIIGAKGAVEGDYTLYRINSFGLKKKNEKGTYGMERDYFKNVNRCFIYNIALDKRVYFKCVPHLNYTKLLEIPYDE